MRLTQAKNEMNTVIYNIFRLPLNNEAAIGFANNTHKPHMIRVKIVVTVIIG